MPRSTSALLVVDVQKTIVARAPGADGVVTQSGRALKAARAAGVQVVYATVGYREGYPEVNRNNRDAMRFVEQGRFLETDPETGIPEEIAPQSSDIHVVKKRVGAFTGGDLDLVLRAQHIDHIVLAGISTSGSILSTVRESADRDFAITVLRDAVTDADPEVHRVLLDKVFPRFAEIMTVKEWTSKIALAGSVA